MQVATGDILRIDGNLSESEARERGLVPLSEEDVPKVKKMNKDRRKGWMRNRPCPCGSGTKFKKCCWENYDHIPLPEK